MKLFLKILGFFFIFLAIVGAILPIMPTTPFVIAAAACFARSSRKFYGMLIKNKYFGHIIKNYSRGKGISQRNKIISIVSLWISNIVTSVLFGSVTLAAVLFTVATGVTLYLLYIPTLQEE